MYTTSSNGETVYNFSISESGFHQVANDLIGRNLTDDEVYEVAQRFDDDWYDILDWLMEDMDFEEEVEEEDDE